MNRELLVPKQVNVREYLLGIEDEYRGPVLEQMVRWDGGLVKGVLSAFYDVGILQGFYKEAKNA